MRGALIFTTFLLLALVTAILWNRRYEKLESSPLVLIRQEGANRITIQKEVGEEPHVMLVPLPEFGACRAVHLEMKHRADQLVMGEKTWHSGRILIEWRGDHGEVIQCDTALSMEGTEDLRKSSMVVHCKEGEGRPCMRIEHLGVSGAMIIEDMKISVVQVRGGWHGWVAGLVLAWLAWWIIWFRLIFRLQWIRSCSGAFACMVMGWFLAIPGPWAHPRPLTGSFDLGQTSHAPVSISLPDRDTKKANFTEPLGEMPVQGSWLVKVRLAFRYLRPVLHMLMFAGPALLLALVCGVRSTYWSLILMSLIVECAQACFWFGFDWKDFMDLIVDWTGIGISLLLLRMMFRKAGDHPFVCMLKRMMPPTSQSAANSV